MQQSYRSLSLKDKPVNQRNVFFRFKLWTNYAKQITTYRACETFYRKAWLVCCYYCKLIVEVVKHLWGFGCLVTWLGSSPDGKTVTLNYGTTDVYCLQLTRISSAVSLSLSQMFNKNKHFKRKLLSDQFWMFPMIHWKFVQSKKPLTFCNCKC